MHLPTLFSHVLRLSTRHPRRTALGVLLGSGAWRLSTTARADQLTADVQSFQTKTLSWALRTSAFAPQDKLYLFRSASENEWTAHDQLRRALTVHEQAVVAHFNQLPAPQSRWWRELQAWWGNSEDPRAAAHMVLRHTQETLALTGELNEALYYFKRRAYAPAKSLLHQADMRVKALQKEKALDTVLPTVDLDYPTLHAHLLNIEAKLARVTGEHERSNRLYTQALDQVAAHPNEPTSRTAHRRAILGSQLALWGDSYWNRQSSNPLQAFLQDSARAKDLEAELAGYGLGLTNLSWLYLQAGWSQPREAAPLAQDYFKRAEHLAGQAITADPTTPTINARLFSGISRMELNQLNAALADFDEGLKRSSHHPSLLRRRAKVLAQLGRSREARAAAGLAAVELRYQLAHELALAPSSQRKRYDNWRTEMHALWDQRSWIGWRSASEQTIAQLIEESPDYDALYKKLYPTGRPVGDDPALFTLHRWFEHHFNLPSTHQPNLLPNIVRNLQVDQLPTPYQLLRLSQATYQGENKGEKPLAAGRWWRINSARRITGMWGPRIGMLRRTSW